MAVVKKAPRRTRRKRTRQGKTQQSVRCIQACWEHHGGDEEDAAEDEEEEEDALAAGQALRQVEVVAARARKQQRRSFVRASKPYTQKSMIVCYEFEQGHLSSFRLWLLICIVLVNLIIDNIRGRERIVL